MRKLFVGLYFVPLFALGEDVGVKCVSIEDPDQRHKCFDDAYQVEAKPAKKQPEARKEIEFLLNDEGKVDSFGAIKMGSKAATFSADHTDGQSYASVKMGVVGVFRATHSGWQPFLGASWIRDAASKSPKDIRDVSVGALNSLWEPDGISWTILAAPRLIRRTDIFGHTSSTIVQLHGNIINPDWIGSESDPSKPYSFIPQVGLQLENKASSKVDNGGWRGMYAGLLFGTKLSKDYPLSASIQYQYYRDVQVPDGNSMRSDGYAKFQLSYELGKDDKSAHFHPSIILSREVGIDPLTGVNQTNTTKLSLGIKVD